MSTSGVNVFGMPAPPKAILVTEGATGLGRALVEHFAAEGWLVLVTTRVYGLIEWAFQTARLEKARRK